MKKVTRIFGMFCMIGLLAFTTSCKKDQETNSSVRLGVPQLSEGFGADRAYIDEEWMFMWHGGDQIMVYNLAEDATQSVMSVFHNTNPVGVETKWATFQGEDVGAPKDYYYRYFYPIGMVSQNPAELREENRQTFTVSPDQNYYLFDECEPLCRVDPEAMPMAINTDDLHKDAVLEHMFGIAHFMVQARRNNHITIESVTLHDNFWNLTGELTVKLHEVDTAQLNQLWNEYAGDVTADPFASHFMNYAVLTMGYDPNPTGKEITLHMMHPDENNPLETVGVEVGTGNAWTEFNFILRPLALSEGFTITLTGTAGENADPYEWTCEKWVNANLEMAIKPSIKHNFTFPVLTEAMLR